MTYQTSPAGRLEWFDWLRTSLPWGRLAARFWRMMLHPREEWALLAYEPPRVGKGMVPYAIILSLFGPAMQFGAGLFEVMFGPQTFSLAGFSFGLLMVWVGAFLNLLVLYAVVQIIQGVALKHGEAVPRLRAYQVGLYGLSAFWVAQGISQLPLMGGAAIIIGLYSLYQLYTGTERLVEVDPADRLKVNLMVPGLALAFYMAIVGVAGLVVWLAQRGGA